MAEQPEVPRINLPRGWPQRMKSAVLHVIALAQYVMTYTRGWAVNARIARVQVTAENARLRQEVALLAEEIRIKDARVKRVEPQRRPLCWPTGQDSVPVEAGMLLLIVPTRTPSFNKVIFTFPGTPLEFQVIFWLEPDSQFSPPFGAVTLIFDMVKAVSLKSATAVPFSLILTV